MLYMYTQTYIVICKIEKVPTKSQENTRQVRKYRSQQLEHNQVPKGGGAPEPGVERVSVPCWHAALVV